MNLDNAQHLLPESIHDMVGIIGLSATMQIVEMLGGISVRFPAKGGQLHPEIECYREVLGDDILDTLGEYFRGEIVYIARCDAALSYIRNQRFVDEVATLTEDGLSTTAAIMRLCPKYKISDRYAWEILKTPSKQTQGSLI